MSKKIRSTLALVLALAMMLTLVLAGCGDSGSSTSTTTTNNTTSSSTDSDTAGTSGDATGNFDDLGDYSFNLSMHDPDTTPVALYYKEWADAIEEATEGHVKITVYGSGTLASSTDCLDMVTGGGVDIGWIYTAFYSGVYPLLDAFALPMMGVENPLQLTEAAWDIYDQYPEVQDELSDYKLLNLYFNPINLVMTNKTAITSLSDIKGMTLRCPTGPMSELLGVWGANPIVMGPGDMYEALEKGNIEGCVFEPSGVTNFSLQEQLKYYTDMNLFSGAFLLAMNWDAWNKLPAEFQQIIEDLSGRQGSLDACTAFVGDAIDSFEVMMDAGMEPVSVSDEALAEFQALADDYNSTWANNLTGVDGAAYLADVQAAIADYAGVYDTLY